MSKLAIPNAFEYVCYGSTAIRNVYSYSGDRLYSSESKVGLRTERVNPFTRGLRNCLLLFFIYMKLELLTQIPDGKKRKTLIFKVVVHCTTTVG